MNIGKILATAGTAVLKNVVPGAGMVVDIINAFLPDDKKITGNSTGTEAMALINALPPDQQALIISRELDVEVAEINSWAAIQESLATADAAGASTRPWIAKLMAIAVFLSVMTFMFAWAGAIIGRDKSTLDAIADSWTIMLAALGTPTALLRAYFGMREREKKARYSAAIGQASISPLAGIVSGLFSRK